MNKFPLYLVLQKGFLEAIHYQLPFVWDGSRLVVNPQAQLVLRTLPDILISFAMTAIVLFFGFRSGFMGGLVAALACLTMPMVWMYWVEERPYSLWFALTVIQSLLFLDTVSKKMTNARKVPFLLVHAGLCLTAPLGVIQTIVCQGLLWGAGTRRVNFYMTTGAVPVFLGAYFFMAQEKMSVYLCVPWQVIFVRNFQPEEMVFLGMYVILLLLLRREEVCRKYFLFGRVFFPFCGCFLAIALTLLFYMAWKSVPSVPVVERHFIFLTPIGIIMTAAIFSDLWLATAKRVWWRLGLMVIFGAGLLGQFLSAFTIVYFSVYY